MAKIKTIVLCGYGINCEVETKEVFKRVGSEVHLLHINKLIMNKKILSKAQILVLPGGFSYGDHISSGKMLANKINDNLQEEFRKFSDEGKFILGICNGFQVLVKIGLLPGLEKRLEKKNHQQVTLMANDNNRFINKWVNIKKNYNNNSPWLTGLEKLDQGLPVPIRHLEGKFYSNPNFIHQIKQLNLPALTYSSNPNGSMLDLAGITNLKGNILGLMPHPEAFKDKILAPHFLQLKLKSQYKKFPFLKPKDGLGMIFFYNIIKHLQKA